MEEWNHNSNEPLRYADLLFSSSHLSRSYSIINVVQKNNELMMRMLRNFFVIHGMHVYAFHCDDELKLMNCKLNLYSEFIIYNVFN